MRRERDKKRVIAEPSSNVVNVRKESDISWGMGDDSLHEGYKKGEHSIVDKGVMPDLVKSPFQTSIYNDEQRGYTAETSDSRRLLGYSFDYKDSPLRAAQDSHNLASNERIKQATDGYTGHLWPSYPKGDTVNVNSNPTRVTPNQFDGN